MKVIGRIGEMELTKKFKCYLKTTRNENYIYKT